MANAGIHQIASQTVPVNASKHRTEREIVYCRVIVLIGSVILAHALSWEWLRYYTSELVRHVVLVRNLQLVRISPDTLAWGTEHFCYVTSCTFIDVFLGCLPLMWDLHAGVPRNAACISATAIGLLCLNITRLTAALALYRFGIAWWFADGVCGGIAYFAAWMALWRASAFGREVRGAFFVKV